MNGMWIFVIVFAMYLGMFSGNLNTPRDQSAKLVQGEISYIEIFGERQDGAIREISFIVTTESGLFKEESQMAWISRIPGSKTGTASVFVHDKHHVRIDFREQGVLQYTDIIKVSEE